MKTWIVLVLVFSITITTIQGTKDAKTDQLDTLNSAPLLVWQNRRRDEMSEFDADDDDNDDGIEAKDPKLLWWGPGNRGLRPFGDEMNKFDPTDDIDDEIEAKDPYWHHYQYYHHIVFPQKG